MITIGYRLPFRFEVPADNPWDGRPVDLTIQPRAPLDDERSAIIQSRIALFADLADAGGLAGAVAAPWSAVCKQPVVAASQGTAVLHFQPSQLDERATACLANLLLSLHDEVPLERVSLSVLGSARHEVRSDPEVDDSYPTLWPRLPFPHLVEESQSESRVLRAQFAKSLDEGEIAAVSHDLLRWGNAAAEGAFAIAPIPPRSCGCLAGAPVEHYEGELIWPIEKCRFHHRGALDSLVSVCAAIHHRIARIVELTVE